MGDWEFEVPTVGSKILLPSARAWDALSSQGYSFEESVADLVDNSVDARATAVVVHFLRDGDGLVSLIVADDGDGMDEDELDVAMTVGGKNNYRTDALGMFGTGLKSASLSQAASVTVVSKTDRGSAVGRRWFMDHARSDHRCDIVAPDYARTLLDRYHGRLISTHGTVVRWDHVKDFPVTDDSGNTDKYLDRLLPALRRHLGLYLHRFLVRPGFDVQVTVEDVRTRTVYVHESVAALNPFDYPISGVPGYPRRFDATVDGVGTVPLTAHVWPPKSNLTQYRSIGPLNDRQGFYLYRNDRLVQAGGWNGYRQPEGHLALARVSVDLPAGYDDVFRLTVKKSGVETSPVFVTGVRSAVAEDGTKFDEYLRTAEATYRDARKHGPTRRAKAIAAGSGIDPLVKHALEDELEFVADSQVLSFRWADLDGEELFELDHDEDIVRLNARYRKLVTGESRGGLNDAPLVKTLLYLLFHGGGVFTGERVGPRVKDNLDLWQAVLSAAVRAELRREVQP